MALSELLSLPSQSACLKILKSKLLSPASKVLLSGPAGCGKSFLCEQTVTSLENSRITAFVPCSAELTLEQLRELCIKQLLPGFQADFSLPLQENFKKAEIADKGLMLLAADDVDQACPDFFNELCALGDDPDLSQRISLLLTASDAWVGVKRQSLQEKFSKFQEVMIPPLSANESALILKSAANRDGSVDYEQARVRFNDLSPDSKGNIGALVKFLDGLKSENAAKAVALAAVPEDCGVKKDKNKKGAYWWLFIIVIAILCLLALFLGDQFKDKLFGKGDDAAGAPTSSISRGADDLKPSGQEESVVGSDDHLLRVSRGAPADLGATGPRGTKETPAEDDGELLPEVTGKSVDATSEKSELRGSVTLRGDTLERIERGHFTTDPTKDLNRDKAAAPGEKRPDDKRIESVKTRHAPGTEPQAKRGVLGQSDLKALRPAQGSASGPVKVRESADAALKKRGQSYSRGRAVPGGSSELASKNPHHYTLQVAAGRSRQNVADASDFVAGRYWIYQTFLEGKPWYVLIAGDYLSADEAKSKAALLPDFLRKSKPFAKTFDSVQREMKQYAN